MKGVYLKKMSSYFESIFLKVHCRFRQGLSAKILPDVYEKFVNKLQSFAAHFTDLSKTFDCFPYDLIIAKLNNTYG